MNEEESLPSYLRRKTLSQKCDSDGLYFIAGSFIHKDIDECRKHISEFEEKHLFYFVLFKPLIEDPQKSWIENAITDIKSIKESGVSPSLRECYAVSEAISRKVVLIYECRREGLRAIEIEPVIREMGKDDKPLILFIRLQGFRCSEIHIVQVDDTIDSLIGRGLLITNKGHSKCLDKRFRNNFDMFYHFLLDKEEYISSPNSMREEKTNMCYRFSQIIYGNETDAKYIKELIKTHMMNDEFMQVYMQLAEEKILTKKSFEKRFTEWNSADKVDLFAFASVFNAEIYVVLPKDVEGKEEANLYLPICGGYLYKFTSPLVFKRKRGRTCKAFEISFEDTVCQCYRNTPDIAGQFPIANNTIDLDRIRTLELMPCCPPVSRHGLHQHYNHIPETKESNYERDDTPWPGGLHDDDKHINDILAEEGRQLELVLGGKGTLAQCISKEVLGDEDAELPISFPENDFERSLQIVANWTGFPIYIFQNSKRNCSWEMKTPTTSRKAKDCRYFITLFVQNKNGREYVDRIISKTGCNCMLAPPYVVKKEEVSENTEVAKENRHRPLITFFPMNPPDNCFSDDVRREMNIIPIHSELRLVMERGDMEDRMIDTISDYTHSLYRCISKDIFGNEEQYQTVMMEIIAEIKENSNLYGHLLITKKKNNDSEFLPNFKYRNHKFLDFLRFPVTKLRESATLFTERIEDGMALQDLELIAAATCFQVPIYVLSASKREDRVDTEWKLYGQIRRRKQPKDFLKRRQYLAQRNAIFNCSLDAENISNFYITLYRTFSGQFHRIASRYRVCNCLTDPPVAFVPQTHKHDGQPDFRIFYDTNDAKSTLTLAKLALDKWMRCNMALEILCSEIIDELEGRRRNVNISNIVGSSAGIAGSALAIAGYVVAPFTAGVSLGLTVSGTVIGTLSGATVAGTSLTEFAMNREAKTKFERYFMNFREQSVELEMSLKKLDKLIQKIQERTNHTNAVGRTALQTAAGTISMVRGIPIAVARVFLRAVSLVDIVLPPFTALFDAFLFVHSLKNLNKGSKTNLTEKLRSLRSTLRVTRTQLNIMAYGNKTQYVQSPS